MSAAKLHAYAPWTDRAGRVSLLKLVVFAACVAPALWMAWEWHVVAWPNPMRGIIRESGDWAIRFLALSVLVTPLRFATRWSRLFLVRRMLGLAGLFYTLAHLAIYVVDREFNLWWMILDLFWRLYISAGWVATVIFVLMGVTSNDWSIRRLGSVRWNRWHAWTYLAIALSLWHIFILVRLDAFEPVLYGGLLGLAVTFRLMRRAGAHEEPLRLALAAFGLAIATALGEALFYRWAARADLSLVLKANFDFTYQVRPAWWILAAGLIIAASALARRALPKRPTLAPA